MISSQYDIGVRQFLHGFGKYHAVAPLKPDCKPEGATLAQGAFHAGIAAHQVRQATGNGQPKACTSVFTGGRNIGLGEGFK